MPSKFSTTAQRHKVLPGYPKEFVFQTPEDVYAYLGGDRVTCLRCGKSYKSLAAHINAIHNMSAEDYKGMYGIPWRAGLTSAGTTEKLREHGKELVASGKFKSTPENRAKAHEAAKNQRARAPMRQVLCDRNLSGIGDNATMLTQDGTTMTVPDWAKKLKLHPDTIWRKLRNGKTIDEALEFVEPFGTPAEHVKKIWIALQDGRLTQTQIANRFNVSQSTVSHINTEALHTSITEKMK